MQGVQVQADALRNHIKGAAGHQRGIQIRRKGVETETGIPRHAGVFRKAHIVHMPAAEQVHIPVGEHASLGRAGGAAGIQEEEKVVFRRGAFGLSGMQLLDIGRFDDGNLRVLEKGKEVFVGDQHPGIGVLHHELEALRRIGRVQREVGAAGLEHAQRGDHHVFVPSQHDAHDAFGRDPALDIGGQVIGQFIDLSIGEADVFVNEGDVVRAGFRVVAESVQDGGERMFSHVLRIDTYKYRRFLREKIASAPDNICCFLPEMRIFGHH